MILRTKVDLKNIPSHVALIFNETCYRSFSLAELLSWLCTLEIRTVTLYSEGGVADRIKSEILRDLGGVISCGEITREQNKMFIRHKPADTVTEISDKEDRDLIVIFIDRTDGKPAIARVATELLANRDKQELSVEEVEREIMRESGFTPPELAIIFGTAFTTSGYPPWHLQFTEMYHLHTHRYIQWTHLLSVLSSFAKTKQNYGK